MLPSVRTACPEKPSVAVGFSYWRNDGEKRSPEIWARSRPPVTVTEIWCWSRLKAAHDAVRLPIWRKVRSVRRRYWNVSNGLDTAEPPSLNGLRTNVPVASTESRLITPGVYAKQ